MWLCIILALLTILPFASVTHRYSFIKNLLHNPPFHSSPLCLSLSTAVAVLPCTYYLLYSISSLPNNVGTLLTVPYSLTRAMNPSVFPSHISPCFLFGLTPLQIEAVAAQELNMTLQPHPRQSSRRLLPYDPQARLNCPALLTWIRRKWSTRFDRGTWWSRQPHSRPPTNGFASRPHGVSFGSTT